MTSRLHPPSPAGYPRDFVASVLDDALTHGCRVYALAGLQGSGKSTLAAQVTALAPARGVRALALSIDDSTWADANACAGREIHPLCATRGPPGTHDVALACRTGCIGCGPVGTDPRFDKIGDRRLPPSRWPTASGIDLVVLEGWCLKVPAQDEPQLLAPLNPLERDEDPDGVWRHWANTALREDYPPLWSRIQRMLLLQAPGFELVPLWRWQQECTLQAAHPQRRPMTRPQVERFVQYFERISRQALHTLPAIADRSVRLDAARRPEACSITAPGTSPSGRSATR